MKQKALTQGNHNETVKNKALIHRKHTESKTQCEKNLHVKKFSNRKNNIVQCLSELLSQLISKKPFIETIHDIRYQQQFTVPLNSSSPQ